MQKVFIFLMVFFGLAGNANSQTDDTILFGRIIASRTKKPIPDAIITIVGTDATKIELKTDVEGKYFATKAQLKEGESYVITCGLLPKFLNKTGKFTLYPKFPDTPIEYNIQLDPAVSCEGMAGPILIFDIDSWEIKENNKTVLNNVAETLTDNPSVVIEISGHADFREKNGMQLSVNRAKAATDYLINKGIDSGRLVPVGNGSLESYVVKFDRSVFKTGDTLNIEYVSKLTDPEAIAESIRLNGAAQFKVLRHGYKTSQ